MVCIYCGSKTKVANSRPQLRSGRTWRRRECNRCHAVFTTLEQVIYNDTLRVRKRSGLTEHFSQEKLFMSILKACDHIPDAPQLSTELTQTVLTKLFRKKPMSPIIETQYISDTIKLVLRPYDAAASVKYLSFQTKMPRSKDIQANLK